MYDVIIIGSGPAGLSAAIYAKRAMLDVLVLEASYMSGGQIVNTYEIENYPGFRSLSGLDLGNAFKDHAVAMGAQILIERVKSVRRQGEAWTVETKKNIYEAKTVVVATGAKNKHLGVPGEEELSGMGVSYCATCDGAFFKGKEVCVMGGGDVALEDALYLARGCTKVHLIHRRDEFRGAKVLQDAVKNTPNIELHLSQTIAKINGIDCVKSVTLTKLDGSESAELACDGVFIAIGMEPVTSFIDDKSVLDERGYIVAGESCETAAPGLFVAGDCRTKQLRQVVTAAADGAVAITNVEAYLRTAQ